MRVLIALIAWRILGNHGCLCGALDFVSTSLLACVAGEMTAVQRLLLDCLQTIKSHPYSKPTITFPATEHCHCLLAKWYFLSRLG